MKPFISPTKEIITKRLRISPWSQDDAKDFFLLSQEQGFTAFPITRYEQTSLESARSWIEHELEIYNSCGLGKMAVREVVSHDLIGMGGLTPWKFQGEHLIDLTYRFRTKSWGQGYGWETARALVNYAFKELDLKEITATITPDNIPSIKLAEKLGMKFDQEIILKSVKTSLFRLGKEDFLF